MRFSYDNDGDLELLIVNGRLHEDQKPIVSV